mmetsp:Transcript_28114/g.29308  ORF Transcript_28114/g.29308 Transcript_28114/m.29308 type:complete len:577 (+) Transcript_28114:79-1809(+)
MDKALSLISNLNNAHSHLHTIKSFFKDISERFLSLNKFMNQQINGLRTNSDIFSCFNKSISSHQEILRKYNLYFEFLGNSLLKKHDSLQQCREKLSRSEEVKKEAERIALYIKKRERRVTVEEEESLFDEVNKNLLYSSVDCVEHMSSQMMGFFDDLMQVTFFRDSIRSEESKLIGESETISELYDLIHRNVSCKTNILLEKFRMSQNQIKLMNEHSTNGNRKEDCNNLKRKIIIQRNWNNLEVEPAEANATKRNRIKKSLVRNRNLNNQDHNKALIRKRSKVLRSTEISERRGDDIRKDTNSKVNHKKQDDNNRKIIREDTQQQNNQCNYTKKQENTKNIGANTRYANTVEASENISSPRITIFNKSIPHNKLKNYKKYNMSSDPNYNKGATSFQINDTQLNELYISNDNTNKIKDRDTRRTNIENPEKRWQMSYSKSNKQSYIQEENTRGKLRCYTNRNRASSSPSPIYYREEGISADESSSIIKEIKAITKQRYAEYNKRNMKKERMKETWRLFEREKEEKDDGSGRSVREVIKEEELKIKKRTISQLPSPQELEKKASRIQKTPLIWKVSFC